VKKRGRRLLGNEKMNDCANGLGWFGDGDISVSFLFVFFLYLLPFLFFLFFF